MTTKELHEMQEIILEQNSYRWLMPQDLEGEVWRDVPLFKGYMVSNMGRIKSVPHVVRNCYSTRLTVARIVHQRVNKDGYACVRLYENGAERTFTVHRLVALAFLPNPNNFEEVNHKDECKSNNRLENLEWCTHLYNSRYGTRTKRIAATQKANKHCFVPVRQYSLDGIFVKEWPSMSSVRDVMGRIAVSQCVRGKVKTAGGYIWRYSTAR